MITKEKAINIAKKQMPEKGFKVENDIGLTKMGFEVEVIGGGRV